MASKWKDNVTYKKGNQGFVMKLDYDFTDLKQLYNNINKINNRHVKVGWIHARKHKGSGFYLAQLAYMQEFGTTKDEGKIPARPYVRQTMKEWGKILKSESSDVFNAVLENRDFESKIEKVGYKSKIAFHNSVMKQNMRRLAKFTIDKKGHGFQWDDTGELLHNFTYKVFKSSLDKAAKKAASTK